MRTLIVTILYSIGSLCFLAGTLVNFFWQEEP